MEKKIIIINGSGGVGKDTFVDICKKYKNCKNISSVQPVKDAAKILGWDGTKDEKSRKFLSDLKRLSIEYNDYSFTFMKNEVNYFHDTININNILFLHIREPEEIEKCKKEFGAITLLLTSSRVEIIESNNSDKRINEYEYDYTIDNSGTLDELEIKAKEFLEKILN